MALEFTSTVVQQKVDCMGKEITVTFDRFYTRDHLWIKVTPEGNLKIGITDYAQQFLKRKAALVEFMKNPALQDDIEEDDVLCTVYGEMYPEPQTLTCECMAFDVISPVTGNVLAVNEAVLDKPALVNADCYDAGWIALVKPVDDWMRTTNLVRPERYVKLVKRAGQSPLRVL